MNAELQETRGLARTLVTAIDNYLEVKPSGPIQIRAANRMKEGILIALRTAVDELADDFYAQAIQEECDRIERGIAQRRAAMRPQQAVAS